MPNRLLKLRTKLQILCDLLKLAFNRPIRKAQRYPRMKQLLPLVSLGIQHKHGPVKIPCSEEDAVLLCLVQDGMYFLEAFFKHYRKLGIQHFIFLENNSSDTTLQHLCEQPDTTVYTTQLPYRNYVTLFKPWLIAHAPKNRWCLIADIDEFLDYPFSDNIGLKKLVPYLNQNQFEVVELRTLDMFKKGALSRQARQSEPNLKSLYCHYDLSGVLKEQAPRKRDTYWFWGGIRQQLFGTKHLLFKELFFLNKGIDYDRFNQHEIYGFLKKADFSGVLLHYSLTDVVFEKAETAVQRKNYFDDSRFYSDMHAVLSEHTHFNVYEQAQCPQELQEIHQLLKDDFLFASEDYLNFCGVPNQKRS